MIIYTKGNSRDSEKKNGKCLQKVQKQIIVFIEVLYKLQKKNIGGQSDKMCRNVNGKSADFRSYGGKRESFA